MDQFNIYEQNEVKPLSIENLLLIYMLHLIWANKPSVEYTMADADEGSSGIMKCQTITGNNLVASTNYAK